MTNQQKEESLNKIIIVAIVGLLGWNMNTTYQLSIISAVLAEKVTNIERTISGTKAK